MAQKFILGKKIGMLQVFDESGNVIPLTWVEAGPCIVLQIKNKEKDGYEGVQIGFEKKTKKTKKSEKGKEYKHIKEFSVISPQSSFKVGDQINVDIFKEGEKVKVSGISKSKGFQGVVKRWRFAGAPKTHGTKHMLRKPGSIGATDPERVFKGKRMAGRMGGEKVTVKNLLVSKVDSEKNIIYVKGAVPGSKRGLITLRKP